MKSISENYFILQDPALEAMANASCDRIADASSYDASEFSLVYFASAVDDGSINSIDPPSISASDIETTGCARTDMWDWIKASWDQGLIQEDSGSSSGSSSSSGHYTQVWCILRIIYNQTTFLYHIHCINTI